MKESTALFNRCIDHMKEQDDRAMIDYYAVDLVDVAVYVVNGWLVLRDAQTLRDARLTERKQALARIYIAETRAKIRGKVAMLQASDPAPIQVRDVILDEDF